MSWVNRSKMPPKAVNWKTNLFALWVSQFLSLAAFNFSLPFMPLYMREKGIVPADRVQFWAGLFIAAASVSLMIMSPIWGVLGDRYGRKMMLVRANLGGAFSLYLMALVDNIEALMVLRLFQGAFTGTAPAAQTLVATATPDKNQGFAMGLIMSAVSAGNTAGLYFGGICAKYYGPEVSFKISGAILFASTILVVMAVRENFTRPEILPDPATRSARIRRRRESFNNFMAGLPVLVVVGYVAYLQTFDAPFLSLFIDDLFRQGPAAAGMSARQIVGEVYGLTGNLSLLSTVGAMVGSIAAGVIMDRKLPQYTWTVLSVTTGAGLLWVYLDPTLTSLAWGRAIFMLVASALASVIIVILGRMTPNSKRGAALGWATTIRSVGWILAPLSGAFAAGHLGFAASCGLIAALSLPLIPGFAYLERRYRSAFRPEDEDPPSIGSVGKTMITAPGGPGKVM